MENRKQKFEELYKQYKELVGETGLLAQDYISGEAVKTKNVSKTEERIRLAKELWEKYQDFVKVLPLNEKDFKDFIEEDTKFK